MREDFLHYIWNAKKIQAENLITAQNDTLRILSFGQYLQQSGPDIFNAKIELNNQIWAGNIEIHVKSSDWYIHKHEQNENYDNVILHVVWEHDVAVFRKDNTEIPVLELKNYVDDMVLKNYENLIVAKPFIYCEKDIAHVDTFILESYKERLFIERLQQKCEPIFELLNQNNNDWEATLFCLLAKNFGLNTNGTIFYKTALSIPFLILQKEAVDIGYLEALLFGQAQMLPQTPHDLYTKELQSWYEYLVLKYKIDKPILPPVSYYKHRPDNFPTIRLAQLAMLYYKERNVFSKLIESKSIQEIKQVLSIQASTYWDTHYTFDKQSLKKAKKLSASFIDLLIINTIIPLKFAFATVQKQEIETEIFSLISTIPAEKNSILDKFKALNLDIKTAKDTQSLLHLKKNYCDLKKCLQCTIGLQVLKK